MSLSHLLLQSMKISGLHTTLTLEYYYFYSTLILLIKKYFICKENFRLCSRFTFHDQVFSANHSLENSCQ